MDLEVEHDNDATDAEYVPDKDDMLEDEVENGARPPADDVWAHFEKLSDNDAKCNYCLKRLSYKHNLAKLKRHTELHSEIEFDEPSPMISNTDKETSVRPSSSAIWKHFLYVSQGKARCKYCREVRSYRTSLTNLRTHMRCKHRDVTMEYDETPKKRDSSVPKKPISIEKRMSGSFIWKHYQYFSRTEAKCNYCHKLRSYKTSITNLKKHMEFVHPEVLAAQEESYTFESEESDSQPEPTRKPNKNRASVSKSILKYYDIRVSDEGSKIASCKVCGEDMEFTIVTQLKYHVVQNHGDLHIKDDKSSDEENKGSERGKRKPSIAWKVFNIVDPVAKIASCKCCGKELSYQASTSNLMKHVARTHGRMHLSSASSEVERPVRPKRSSGPLVRKKRSTAWKYFTIADPVAKTATCKCCSKELSYQTSTSNLMKHVLKIHADVVFGSVSSEDDVKVERDTSFTPKLRKPHVQTQFRSAAWKHFTVVDPKAKMAKCNLCRQNFSYVWISNLSKHLLRMHQEVGQSSDEEVDEVVTDAPVWAYFKCLDETLKIASCLICKMRVEYNDDQDLHRHLKRKHPYVDLEETKNKPKKLMITGNGDIYEIDDDNTTKQEPESETNKEENENDSDGWQNNEEPDTLNMTETSYLDETIFDEPEYVPPKTKRRVPNPTPQQTSEETSLDIFGKYMVSLLKKLPKHTSDQLQVEFVRQIMDAQQNNQDHRYNSQKRRNSRSNSQKINNDDTRVTSNSDVQRVITTRNGEIQLSPLTVSSGSRPLTRSEQILVSSACDEITVTTE